MVLRAGVVMAPVEITPIGGGGPRPRGSWARTPSEIEENWGILGVLTDSMTADPSRSFSDLSHGERYTLGIRAAARWTLGLSDRTPLTGEAWPPDADRVASELAVAEFLVAGDTPSGPPAAGVLAWLAWLTGAVDRMVFMAL